MDLNISSETIRRRLKESGLSSFWTTAKPLVTKWNRAKRVQWAKQHIHWTYEDWSKVLFSDESPYTISSQNKRKIWRFKDERSDPRALTSTIKGNGKINVWGCFTANKVGNLYRIYGTMDGDDYRKILIHQMVPSGKKIFGNNFNDWIFQHDNDPKHTLNVVQNYIANKQVRVLPWPSQSPDLNPIKNYGVQVKRSKCNEQ